MSDIWQHWSILLTVYLLGKFLKPFLTFWLIVNFLLTVLWSFFKNRFLANGQNYKFENFIGHLKSFFQLWLQVNKMWVTKKRTSVGGRKQRFCISKRYTKSLGGEIPTHLDFAIPQNLQIAVAYQFFNSAILYWTAEFLKNQKSIRKLEILTYDFLKFPVLHWQGWR